MWVSWICLFLLSYPATTYTITTVNGPYTFTLAHNVWTFTALMAVLGRGVGLRQGECLQVHRR